LNLEIVASDSRINFYTQTYCSTQVNVSKHKSLYLQLKFSHNQFIGKTKHTLTKTAYKITYTKTIDIILPFNL